MRPRLFAAIPLASLFLFALPLQAQERSPEMQRLDYLVGTWNFTNQGAPGTWRCERFGTTFLRCDAETTGPSGNRVATVDLFAYDAGTGTYPWYRFLTNGVPEEATGRLQGDTWTFTFDEPHQGRRRVLLIEESPTSLMFRWEDMTDTGGWSMTAEYPMTKNR